MFCLFQTRNHFINFDDISLLIDKLREDMKIFRQNATILQKKEYSGLANQKTDLICNFVFLRGSFCGTVILPNLNLIIAKYCDKLEIETVNLKDEVTELNLELKLELEKKKEIKTILEELEGKAKNEIEKLKLEIQNERFSFQKKDVFKF